MDLGRPVARHDIRRPHEVHELEEILVEQAGDEQQPTSRSETAER